MLEGNYLNIMKAIYEKPTGSVVLKVKNKEIFPLRLGRRQGCPISLLLFKIVLQVLARKIRQEKEKYNRREKVKLSSR